MLGLTALCLSACKPLLPTQQASSADTAPISSLTENEAAPLNSISDSAAGPAGILLYCYHQGEIHVLVANDRFGKRGWGGFAGGEHKGETTAMTAARETHEETRGYYDQMKLFRQIKDQKPFRQWGFSLYFAEVPYVPAKVIMDHPLTRLSLAYMETQHYAWVPFVELEPLLAKKTITPQDLKIHARHLQANSRSDSYWRIWIDNMRQVYLKDGFPWNP